MDNIIMASTENTLNSCFKASKSQVKAESAEMEVKKKILGVKDQIRKEKAMLLRRPETGILKGKKTLTQGRLTRKLRQ